MDVVGWRIEYGLNVVFGDIMDIIILDGWEMKFYYNDGN